MFTLDKMDDGMFVRLRDDRDGAIHNCSYHTLTDGHENDGIIVGDSVCALISQFDSNLSSENYTIMNVVTPCDCYPCGDLYCTDCNHAVTHFQRSDTTELRFTLPEVIEILYTLYDADKIEIDLGTFGGSTIK